MSLPLIPTAMVGSYVQPDWLIDRARLAAIVPPRVRAREIWRIPEPYLAEAQDAATLVAIRDQERAGIDIVTDGEIRRESYSNRFQSALEGVDVDNPATIVGRSGREMPVPRVTGPIRRRASIQRDDVTFLRANTTRTIKMTLPGPFTLAQVSYDEHYGDEAALAMAYADVVAEEVAELFEAGADIVQLDEPWMQARPDAAKDYAVEAVNRALAGATGTTAVHLCFGYGHIVKDKPSGYSFLPELAACVAEQISIEAAQPNLDLAILEALPGKTILLGVLDLGTETPETAAVVAERLRAALAVLPAERIIAAPDCGMKYLSRPSALAKLKALADGAATVRAALN